MDFRILGPLEVFEDGRAVALAGSKARALLVTAFVRRALAFFEAHGIRPRRLQTDNALAYVKNVSLRQLLAERGIQHRTIPPRTPKRNGISRQDT